MEDPKISDSSVALTQEELDVLDSIVGEGDRGGFYMAYYDMTGSAEAALQAKISTFSESEGGFAYAANWMLSQVYGNAGLFPGTYPGIYYLSQQVAESAFTAIEDDVGGDGTGLISDTTFFNSAMQAWSDNGIGNLFPGNLLALLLGGFTLSNLSVLLSQGSFASFLATIFAADVGKQQADFSGYTQIDGPNGSTIVVDSSGHVVATLNLSAGLVSAISNVGAFLGSLSPQIIASLANPAVAPFVSALLTLSRDAAITQMLGGNPDWSQARTGLSELSGAYNGDVGGDPNSLDPQTISWVSAPDGNNDILQAQPGQALDTET